MKPVLLGAKQPGLWISFFVFAVIFSAPVLYYNEYLKPLVNLIRQQGVPDALSSVLPVVISLLFALIIALLIKNYRTRKLALLTFTVHSMSDGAYHFVRVPGAISSADFLKLFFQYLATKLEPDRVRQLLRDLRPYLEIRRSDKLIEVGREQSLQEAGIQNGEICQLKGKPKKVNV